RPPRRGQERLRSAPGAGRGEGHFLGEALSIHALTVGHEEHEGTKHTKNTYIGFVFFVASWTSGASRRRVHCRRSTRSLLTRALDFGYSFSVEESIEKWGHDEIVGDFVRHIRAIRPDVIAAFLCGGEGGGQHHQASAQLTIEAFRAAADPAKYPEQIKEGL